MAIHGLAGLLIGCALAATASPAAASELFGGILAHDVNTPLTDDIHEKGADFELGWRSAPITPLGFLGGPRFHVMGSVNSVGDTDFGAAGLDWRIGIGPVYVRPGLGIAIHDGPRRRVDEATGYRTDLGSRVLFEPELSVGTSILPGVSVEASWVHLSQAQIFSRQNPGIDMIGARMAVRIP